MVADDLGFHDVSFHGSSEIPTPNIDALAYNGVILNRFYTLPLCTPSRSCLMTGRHPIKTGMQHYVIVSDEPWGLGLNEKIMPEYFKDAGYKTHLIGKWHLGFHQKQYTPTMRGFDTFYGYYGPYIGYYDHSLEMFDRNYSRGYDMRRDLEVEPISNTYATELFTSEAIDTIKNHDIKTPMFLMINHLAPHAGNEDNPMEAPQDEIDKFEYIENEQRRTLAAMISILDRGVGEVVQALKDKEILNNTIILFFSDNGAPTLGHHSTMGSNYPLRGVS
jgi:arylsulfatase B